MTDPISRYEQLKQERELLDKQMEDLEKDEAFKNDMACKRDIEQFLEGYGKTPNDLPRLFPEIAPNASSPKRTRTSTKPKTRRPLIRYTHPTTGETVESRGLNHKTLQEWIKENDIETVKGWGEPIADGDSS
ncbi:H-NS histone family protein [Halomonas campisalis]|uniref:H-NS histone family protein n=1 Tax=Billgrantia campisalis TaxID=74661 RepID=A0ABS9PDK0_9GAMM|nr:H-NS family nucleoid-associated regulatory protein [Halomonas campisalis]MCG6659839.1 H-NS histone family protein [Halomonas campisalis]MDR5865051.1 H-NS family nucleoid-associated regulatory protein [Halomonas campisalis]